MMEKELMEKLENKNKEITERLVVNFVFHVLAIILFTLTTILSINGIQKETSTIFMMLQFIGLVVSLLLIRWMCLSYVQNIKGDMKEYKNCVYIAMHKKEDNLEKLEKEEVEHIPQIDNE